ncbi:MAG TPA: DHA2 family efflux MFS transporter permease subunit [Acidimicrobiales bacterium]|jgi:EmrB/QacA subfamily drug resistance transporter|nr:DHA2 family efflux MFS transporter permease subunit [Acidimicrobiales bacterium]
MPTPLVGGPSPRSSLRDPDVAHGRRWFTLLVLCLSLMVIGIDNTILNVALPTLSKPVAAGGLGASASQLQWIVDAYTLVFAGLLLTAGSLGDRFGRYRGLTLGLVIFGIGSTVSAFAPSAGALIGTRALMGIGGAFIMPSTLSILTNVFTDPSERAKAIGIWAGVTAIGLGFGPLAGGALLTHFWWGSVFLVNVPVVLLALVCGYALVPESRDPSAPRLDPIGSLLSIVGLGSLLWAIIEGPSYGWGSASIVAGFAVAVVLLLSFVAWELHCESPMLDVRFFQNPRFTVASGAITVIFLALFGMIFLLTQYLQSVLGYSTVKAGAILIPQSMTLMILAPLSPRWVRRFGNKLVVAGGMIVAAMSQVLMLTLTTSSSTLWVIFITVLLGAGMANIMAPATDSIMGSLPKEKAGVGSAMNDTTRQVGGAVGVALLGSILTSHYTGSVASALSGHVPGGLISTANQSIGSAVGAAADPANSAFAQQILAVTKQSFVEGLHTAVTVGAVIIVLGALAVLKWLPARAMATGVATANVADAVPMGVGPVDVVPAELGADVADELSLSTERA